MTWAAVAHGASVVCDPEHASAVVADARVDPRRAPVTHPWLVPGLALASGASDVKEVMASVCAAGAEVAVERAEIWEQAPFSAYTLVVSRVTHDGCSLVRGRVPLTVGVSADGATYALRGTLPDDRTPIGDCADPGVWREERVLEGHDGPVRLVVVVDRRGDETAASALVVRRATAAGWQEQVLLDPAPPRVIGSGEDGPEVHLVAGGALVVATRERAVGLEGCRGVGDQQVWHLEGGAWIRETGRVAVTRLARAGAWRFAGQDGWFLLVGQDDEEDRALVGPRIERLQHRTEEPLDDWLSSDFPELNPGYVFVAPDPYATREEAEAAAGAFPRSRHVYVKRAWAAEAACPGPLTR